MKIFPNGLSCVSCLALLLACSVSISVDASADTVSASQSAGPEIDSELAQSAQDRWHQENLWGFPPHTYYRWRLEKGSPTPLQLAGRMWAWAWNHSYGPLLRPLKPALLSFLKGFFDLVEYLGSVVATFLSVVLLVLGIAVLGRVARWFSPSPWEKRTGWRYRFSALLSPVKKLARFTAIAHLVVWSLLWTIVYAYGLVYNFLLAKPYFDGFQIVLEPILEPHFASALMSFTLLWGFLGIFLAVEAWLGYFTVCEPRERALLYALWSPFFALVAHNPLCLDFWLTPIVFAPLLAFFLLFMVGGKVVGAISDRI